MHEPAEVFRPHTHDLERQSRHPLEHDVPRQSLLDVHSGFVPPPPPPPPPAPVSFVRHESPLQDTRGAFVESPVASSSSPLHARDLTVVRLEQELTLLSVILWSAQAVRSHEQNAFAAAESSQHSWPAFAEHRSTARSFGPSTAALLSQRHDPSSYSTHPWRATVAQTHAEVAPLVSVSAQQVPAQLVVVDQSDAARLRSSAKHEHAVPSSRL